MKKKRRKERISLRVIDDADNTFTKVCSIMLSRQSRMHRLERTWKESAENRRRQQSRKTTSYSKVVKKAGKAKM